MKSDSIYSPRISFNLPSIEVKYFLIFNANSYIKYDTIKTKKNIYYKIFVIFFTLDESLFP